MFWILNKSAAVRVHVYMNVPHDLIIWSTCFTLVWWNGHIYTCDGIYMCIILLLYYDVHTHVHIQCSYRQHVYTCLVCQVCVLHVSSLFVWVAFPTSNIHVASVPCTCICISMYLVVHTFGNCPIPVHGYFESIRNPLSGRFGWLTLISVFIVTGRNQLITW